MKLYPLFLLMAAATVCSPGPGVVMTLTNAIRHGMRGTFGGILGIAIGALVVAAISVTGVGVLLATSAKAFNALKIVGAGYLIYLGIRLWRAPAFTFAGKPADATSLQKRLVEGLSLQVTNPHAIFFFLSVFPQFIEPDRNYSVQFAALVLTYSALVVAIHCLYAAFAHRAKGWLASDRIGANINKAAAATFAFFGIALLAK